jgi:hypothetical protein
MSTITCAMFAEQTETFLPKFHSPAPTFSSTDESKDDICKLVQKIKLYLGRYLCLRHDFFTHVRLWYGCHPSHSLNVWAVHTSITWPNIQEWMINFTFRCILKGYHPSYFINVDAVRACIAGLQIMSHSLWVSACYVKAMLSHHLDGIIDRRQTPSHNTSHRMGGGVETHSLKGHFLKSYCMDQSNVDGMEDLDFYFFQYVALAEMSSLCMQDGGLIASHLPIDNLAEWLTRDELRNMASLHNISFRKTHLKPALKALFTNHTCDVCNKYVSLFRSPTINVTDKFTGNNFCNDNIVPLVSKVTDPPPIGTRTLPKSCVWSYCIDDFKKEGHEASDFTFVQYLLLSEASNICNQDPTLIPFNLPMKHLTELLTRQELRNMALLHNIRFLSSDRKPVLKNLFQNHHCDVCDKYVSVFRSTVATTKQENDRNRKRKSRTKFKMNNDSPIKFPPLAPASPQIEQIVNDFCTDTGPSAFEESGCAVCGQLKCSTDLTPLRDSGCNLSCLIVEGVSRQERLSSEDPVHELQGPIVEHSCDNICSTCLSSVLKGKIPKHALANGLWLGNVPDQLKGLTFAEQMMIARVRHNRAVVRVSSGRAKMVANVIMFANPTVSVYRMLPPSRDEMKEVLAFIFTGSAQPTDEDFKRTPFLVRREKVSKALDWLKLNHSDYKDLEISRENLDSYPLSGVPIVVDYKRTSQDDSNKIPSAMSSHDMEEEEGTEEGICPFTVHGITGEEFTKLSMTALKARALKHLEDQGKMLGIGHEDKPQSMYDNPQAYPQMFPWLFPYGYGGIGQASLKKKVSEADHKKCLLMYHDKRFQTDLYFPIVAFNHEQLKAGITGSFLMVKRQKFNEISQRLMSLDKIVLSRLVKRLTDGEHVRAETEEERACFAVLEDLDHVGGHVKGSLTSKKYMRNELWSLISFLGAPSWFITLSPADNRHPICLYFADTGEKFSPELRSSAVRNHLIASNPVAAARFFDLMVRSFIKNVLGVDHEHPGLYGKTSGYYGTVEQQGRLTLHLHLLLWIAGALSPQEIRDRLVSQDSVFQQELIQYLESVHQGEFLTGTMDSVRASVPMQKECHGGIHAVLQEQQPTASLPSVPGYKDPTQTLPRPAPSRCPNTSACDCAICQSNGDWWKDYYTTVDDLLLKSNIHRCTTSSAVHPQSQAAEKDYPVTSKKHTYVKQGPKGCLDRNGICRARFPREIHETTTVDEGDGHVVMKKLEANMNTFTPCLTYLTRCNTDVTSLSSGTSIKAIVSYISDYVTKPALKTHQIFSSMYDVFERNKVQLGTDVKTESDAGRRLILNIVNSLNAKLEIGSPMASMYLLGNPDHYTGHQFVCFWWKSYVTYIQKSNEKSQTHKSDAEDLKASHETKDCDHVKIGQENGLYIATTNVDDYKYRPDVYANVSLYEWIQTSHKRRANKKELERLQNSSTAKSTRSAYHQFKDGHPMRATHVVKCDFDKLVYVVPNIVGGALPRHDAGNRDYYCCTMLTLFCPWRTDLCIKQPCQSWESAFNTYQFLPRQKQLMSNFNLRYECLDARDDFHAQLKKKTQSKTPWYNGGDSDLENDDDFVTMPPVGRIDHGLLGRSYLSALKMMDSISSVLEKAGWLDRCSEVVPNTYERLQPEYIPGSSWSTIIKNRCIAIFKGKFAMYEPPSQSENRFNRSMRPANLVRILTGEYFRRNFIAEKKEANDLINNCAAHFSLNEEQERAFRIIANHASASGTEQLKMYLGGMGGTGKTQVIKALIYLFAQRKEDHRFAVLAPTGTAAALLNGSTYHKALGIYRKSDVGQDFSRSESAVLNEARSRFQGVEYVFIDEVSMIACHELYSISARLAQITSMHDAPFGGMNIILAGDFAQLPPVFGSSLYDGNVEKYVNARMSVRDQEATIGKVLWHQITTVVILKQNMRQKTQTEADAKLRTALENMRYAACTPKDIAFLKTLIAGQNENSPSLNDSRFRNVSIITARNNQRDRINEEGGRKFAADHGLELTHFYSLDELAGGDNSKRYKRRRKRGKNNTPTLSGLTRADQDALWECYPHMSDHIAGKLSLCIGMPIMIRNNEATELCVTKGQEAVVVGWDASSGPYEHQILETLFVQLVNPPKDVQLADLPKNVIPLTKTVSSIQCKARSDQLLQIKRQQVPVLLNFAMTDYASQGKTREYNVVDLGYSRDHQSYYTALSRSSSAAGTVLIQTFNERKITGGISGWLRQEFRELNILDEVTRLRYESRLPDNIFGPLRNPVVRAYYLWIKDLKDDDEWHSVIQYKVGECKIKQIESDATWDINMFNALRKVEKVATAVSLKRGAQEIDITETQGLAVKMARRESTHDSSVPLGLIWDSKDYSCAYDSLFTILYNIWTEAPTVWSGRFRNVTDCLSMLSDSFLLVKNGTIAIEGARDAMRRELNRLDSRESPMGAAFTCLAKLTSEMMGNNHDSGAIYLSCITCGYKGNTLLHISEYFQLKDSGPLQDGSYQHGYISDCLALHLTEKQKVSTFPCPRCPTSNSNTQHLLTLAISMNRLPYIMCIMLNKSCFQVNETLNYVHDEFDVIYRLKGIVYGDGNHFVARLFTKDCKIWYHDGMTTGSNCHFEGNLENLPDTEWLKTASKGFSRREAILVVYTRD